MLLEEYIQEITGENILTESVQKEFLNKLPLYINEMYKLSKAKLLGCEFLLAEFRQKDFSILQTEKHFIFIRNALNRKVVLLMNEIASFNRKRLIEKRINFVIPGKQLFLPDLLIDLRESFAHAAKENNTLLPSAQLLVLYHILNRDSKWNIENHSFKELAGKLGYTPMAVTKAIDNLKYHGIVDVAGEKEKYIHFRLERAGIWQDITKRKLWINPVIKRVFVDEKPKGAFVMLSNTSALPEYTDMNPGTQEFYAIDKNVYYDLEKKNVLVNANDQEGKYCLEVWKYNPLKLVEELNIENMAVDPLSLYLSLKDNNDERIQLALQQITDKFIW
jgi:hypothetical protein